MIGEKNMGGLAFSHMALTCKDPLAIERFYCRYFDFKRARIVELGKSQVIFLKMGTIYLELFQSSKETPVPKTLGTGPEYPGWRHLAFMVDDVDAKVVEMGAAARITAGPMNFNDFIRGWRSVWLADPEDNVIEISQGFVDQANPPSILTESEVE
jgi:glyoxylase I family protein